MAASREQQQWSGHGEQFDLLPGVGDDADFGDFLDLNLDQEFPIFDLGAEHGHQQQADIQDVLDPQLLQDADQHSMAEQHKPQVLSSHDRNNPNFALAAAEQHGNAMYHHNTNGHYELMQQHGSEKHTMFSPQGIVPPTPNSVQMYSDRAGYMRRLDAQALAGVDQRYPMRKENMTFTPLLSPAATPHDGLSQMPQEIVPGAYFSPLTSPAIQGQPNSGNHTPQFQYSGRQSNSSTTTSPVDVDVDMLSDPAISQPRATRKSSRRRLSTSGVASARSQQLPTARSRGTKRKGTVSTSPVDQTQRSQAATRVQPESLSVPLSQSNSETGSISPEPLSEAVMGPPPKPRSALQSPAIQAENEQMRGGVPATPASLMRIANGKLSASQSGTVSPSSVAQDNRGRNASSLEDLVLPEAAVSPSASTTPYASARPTPKLGPLNTSTTSTPIASPVTPSAGQKRGSAVESRPRRGKKRNSTSISDGRPPAPSNGNALISPALRPKISPSIKPLQPSASGPTSAASSMPATPMSLSEQTAHLLLASKSNYQHLVDGTNVNVPGLEYPESLSTGLTSKRTSHKIAEQGRRNRINVALAEMGRLLPPELRGAKSPTIGAVEPEASTAGQKQASGGAAAAPGPADMLSGSSGSAANAGNSKAATVESAIVYIRMLQQQAEDRDAAMREKEREIERLRRKLDAGGTRAAADEEKVEAEGEKRSGDGLGETDVAVDSGTEGSAEEHGKDSSMDVDGRTEDG